MEFYTFTQYTEMPDSLTFDEMVTAEQCITKFVRKNWNDEDLRELYGDFINSCLKYAQIRQNWILLTMQEKENADPARTAVHDALISSMRPLIRYMIYITDNAADKEQLQKIWQMVSLEHNRGEMVRKRIGDFACYLAFIIGLNMR